MKETIKQYIVEECDKLIKRHYMRVKIQKEFQKRYHKRTGLLATKPSTYLPQLWESVPLFNPFYVRSRADTIAHSISNKIRSFAYEPQPCVENRVL
jgi:hypothetical protein